MKLLIIASAIFLLALLAGCDPAVGVTFVNQTEQKLESYTQGDISSALRGARSVSAELSLVYGWIPAYYRWLCVAATSEDGQWVFDHKYTRDELGKAQGRMVVSSLEPIPPPSDVKVYPSSRGDIRTRLLVRRAGMENRGAR